MVLFACSISNEYTNKLSQNSRQCFCSLFVFLLVVQQGCSTPGKSHRNRGAVPRTASSETVAPFLLRWSRNTFRDEFVTFHWRPLYDCDQKIRHRFPPRFHKYHSTTRKGKYLSVFVLANHCKEAKVLIRNKDEFADVCALHTNSFCEIRN